MMFFASLVDLVFFPSATLDCSRDASSGFTFVLSLALFRGAMRLARLASIFSLIFFLRYSSYSNGLATARMRLYRPTSTKKPCMYPRRRGVPTRFCIPMDSISSRVRNL